MCAIARGDGNTVESNITMMRSRAVGIDKQKNGFVNLCNFPVLFLNVFKPFIG